MAVELKLPDLGEGLTEAVIVKWFVRTGEEVDENQPLVQVETDKTLVDIPSPASGKVAARRGDEGETVPVGALLVAIESTEAHGPPATAGRPLATPSVRKRAREKGIDLGQVQGSGHGGRILMSDLETFSDTSPSTETNPTPPSAETESGRDEAERIPLSPLRRTLSQRLAEAQRRVPQVTHMDEADATELVDLRKKAARLESQKGVNVTYLPFFIKAVTTALREYPALNGRIDEDDEALVLQKAYHIGIATATEAGLLVPVVRHADRLSILEIAAEVSRLTKGARERTIQPHELHHGTFTITNIGSLGGTFATPIVNYPEVAILAIHRIRERPVVKEGDIVARHMVTLSLSFDHRACDGDTAAGFTNRLIRLIEDPTRLLVEMR